MLRKVVRNERTFLLTIGLVLSQLMIAGGAANASPPVYFEPSDHPSVSDQVSLDAPLPNDPEDEKGKRQRHSPPPLDLENNRLTAEQYAALGNMNVAQVEALRQTEAISQATYERLIMQANAREVARNQGGDSESQRPQGISAEQFRELQQMSAESLNRPDVQNQLNFLKGRSKALHEQLLGAANMREMQKHHRQNRGLRYFAVHMPINTLNFYFGIAFYNAIQCMGTNTEMIDDFAKAIHGEDIIGTNGIFFKGDSAPCIAFYESLKDWRTWVGFVIFVETSRLVGGLTGKVSQYLIMSGEKAAAAQMGKGVLLNRVFGRVARTSGLLFQALGGSYLGLSMGHLMNETFSELFMNPYMDKAYEELKKQNYRSAAKYFDSLYKVTFGDPAWWSHKQVGLSGLLLGAMLAKFITPALRLAMQGVKGAGKSVSLIGSGVNLTGQGAGMLGNAVNRGAAGLGYTWFQKPPLRWVSHIPRSVLQFGGHLTKWTGQGVSGVAQGLANTTKYTDIAGSHGRVNPITGRAIGGAQRFVIHGAVHLVVFFLAIEAAEAWIVEPYIKQYLETEKLDKAVKKLNQFSATAKQNRHSRISTVPLKKMINETERAFDDHRNYIFGRAVETVDTYSKELEALEDARTKFAPFYQWIIQGARTSEWIDEEIKRRVFELNEKKKLSQGSDLTIEERAALRDQFRKELEKDKAIQMWEGNARENNGLPWHSDDPKEAKQEIKTHLWHFFCAENPKDLANRDESGSPKIKEEQIRNNAQTIFNVPLPNWKEVPVLKDLLGSTADFMAEHDGRASFNMFGVALNHSGACKDSAESITDEMHSIRLARAQALDFGFDSKTVANIQANPELNVVDKAKAIAEARESYRTPEKLGNEYGDRVERVLVIVAQPSRLRLLANYRRLMQKKTFKALYGRDAVQTEDGSYIPDANSHVDVYTAIDSGHMYKLAVIDSYDQEIKFFNTHFLAVEGFETLEEIPQDYRFSRAGHQYRMAAHRASRKKESLMTYVKYLTAADDEARRNIRLENTKINDAQQIQQDVEMFLQKIPEESLEYVDGIIRKGWEDKMMVDK